jgi:hypothetical protein
MTTKSARDAALEFGYELAKLIKRYSEMGAEYDAMTNIMALAIIAGSRRTDRAEALAKPNEAHAIMLEPWPFWMEERSYERSENA